MIVGPGSFFRIRTIQPVYFLFKYQVLMILNVPNQLNINCGKALVCLSKVENSSNSQTQEFITSLSCYTLKPNQK